MIIDRDDNGRIKKKYNDDDFIKLCEEYKINKNAKEISERENWFVWFSTKFTERFWESKDKFVIVWYDTWQISLNIESDLPI